MKNLAIIPARGGSKRLPKKNITLLNGKPLIEYTIEAALQSRCFHKIILSSDDSNILSVGERFEDVDCEKRPERLASDNSKVLELICEISHRPEFASEFDTITLLLPTCPFRAPVHIQEGFQMLDRGTDGVVSLTLYDFPPQLSVSIDEKSGFLQPTFSPCALITGDTRSQDQVPIYHPNGGFYIQRWSSFVRNQNFFKGNIKGYEMERLHSVDIDEESDLQYAQFLMKSEAFLDAA